MQREKKLFRHKRKTSCDLLATAKNVFPFTFFGGIDSKFVMGILRGIEFDLKTRFLTPALVLKVSQFQVEIASTCF